MATEYKYRIYCKDCDDGSYVFTGFQEDAPTTCPNNSEHDIKSNSVVIVDIQEGL